MAAAARGSEGAGIAVLLYGALLLATAGLAGRAASGREMGPLLGVVHIGWALPALSIVFTGLRWLAPAMTSPERQFDDRLAALDRDWFGLDIPRWSERILTPGLADPFMVFYALYFLMPVATLLAFLVRGDRSRAYRGVFTVSAALYASYALYMLVPAAGPRHAYVGRSAPLPEGILTGWTHDFIMHLEPQPFDAFPSVHVVLGALCAALCWPFGGALRWGMAAVAAGTVASTLVLRYHYLVDDLAGLAVAGAALGGAAFLARRAERKTAASSHGDRMDEMLSG